MPFLGKENISLTLTLKADNLISQLESNNYPSISNSGNSIVLEFNNSSNKTLKIFVSEKDVRGEYYEDDTYVEEYVYLDVTKVQNLIQRHEMQE